MPERIDIERAPDKLAGDEAGFTFQNLAVVLAKFRWPELITCERHADHGFDAYAPVSVAPDGRGKGQANRQDTVITRHRHFHLLTNAPSNTCSRSTPVSTRRLPH